MLSMALDFTFPDLRLTLDLSHLMNHYIFLCISQYELHSVIPNFKNADGTILQLYRSLDNTAHSLITHASGG